LFVSPPVIIPIGLENDAATNTLMDKFVRLDAVPSKGIFVTLFDLGRDVYSVFVYASTKGVCATAERAAIRVVVAVLTEYEYTFELEVVA